MTIDIIYEDEYLIAINKPSGLIVHPDGKTTDPTLVDWIMQERPDIQGVGEPITLASGEVLDRPGVVHRLDKDTSGLLLIAKTQESFDSLKQQFQEGRISKTYQAVVHGTFQELVGAIDRPIGRSRKDFRLRSAETTARGTLRDALTEYKVVADQHPYSLVEIHPKTGRTHQIRVHFKAIGHPVVCDPLYGKGRSCPAVLGRLGLHALAVEFETLEGLKMRLQAPLPSDMREAIHELFGLS